MLEYLFSRSISSETVRKHFIGKLSSKELESLILAIRRYKSKGKGHHELHVSLEQLLDHLLNDKEVKHIGFDMVSLIFELEELSIDEQWDYLEKCNTLCPEAHDIIYIRYLSYAREQKDELLQLVTFHRDLLLSALKSDKNG